MAEELKTNNMARINGSGFKMKSSPTKGKLDNFFSSLGSQLKQGQKERGIFSEAGKAEKKSRKAGESKYQFDVRTRKARNKAKRSMVDKNKDKISDFIQPHSITDPTTKGQETVSSKSKSKAYVPQEFKGEASDKFRYRQVASGGGDAEFEFMKPGSNKWTPAGKNKDGSWRGFNAIADLYIKTDVSDMFDSPVEKKSPSKKRGYKMNRKK
jgi:hypothetical protein